MATNDLPNLGSLISTSDIPEELGIVQQELEPMFQHLFYQNFEHATSASGDNTAVSMELVANTRIAWEVEGTDGLAFVLNPDDVSNTGGGSGFTPGCGIDIGAGDLMVLGNKIARCILDTNGEAPFDDLGNSINPTYWQVVPGRGKYKAALDLIHKIIIRSFGNGDIDAINLTNALTLAQVPTLEHVGFMNTLKKRIGIRGRYLWVHFRNHYELLRKFEFGDSPNYVQHLRAVYNEFYLPSYYNVAIRVLRKGAYGIKTEPNEVEKYIIASAQYNRGSITGSISMVRHCINTHDFAKWKSTITSPWTVEGKVKPRATTLKNYLKNSPSSTLSSPENTHLNRLYRNVNVE